MPPKDDIGSRGFKERTDHNSNQFLPSGKSWFFGIGINKYEHFTPLNNAVKDVEDISRLLQQQYDIDETRIGIHTLEKPGIEEIIGCSRAGEDADHPVHLRKNVRQVAAGVDLAENRIAGTRGPAGTAHIHARCSQEAGGFAANTADADDQRVFSRNTA